MERLRAHRFEIDPTDRQLTAFRRASALSRIVFNWGLAHRMALWELAGEPEKAAGGKPASLTDFDQMGWFRAVQDDELPWAREFSKSIPEHALTDLYRAYKNWWDGTGRSPRFKAKDRTPPRFRARGAISIVPGHIVKRKSGPILVAATLALPRMGTVRLKGHPGNRVAGKIKQATVSECAGRWFVSLLVAEEVADPTLRVPASEAEVVGIDVGLRNSLTLSNGEVIQGPRALAAALVRLRRAEQAKARSQRNSNRRKRTVARVARLRARVGSARRNWQHEVSDDLTKRFAVIGHETLAAKNLSSAGGHNGRAWADLGIAEVFRQIGYKAAWRGVTVVKADRFYPSSKNCSACGARHPNLKRNDTIFLCPACGFRLDRDLNAAINLRPVAAIPVETLNARGGNARPRPASPVLWQIPMKREPASGLKAA